MKPARPALLAPRRARLHGLALLLGLLLMLPLLWRLFGPRGVEVELQRKTWRLEIDIQKRVLERESGWCDALPAQAREVQRRWLSDPAGERPGLAEHCRYALPQWRALRQLRAEGAAPRPPLWPAVDLAPEASGEALGAERLGERRALYEVELAALATGQRWHCRLDLAHWQALPTGRRLRLRVDRQGVADCSSLPRPRSLSGRGGDPQ